MGKILEILRSGYRLILRVNLFLLGVFIYVVIQSIPYEGLQFFPHSHYSEEIKNLKAKRDDLKREIDKKQEQNDMLNTRKDRIEKFAREQFNMVAEDEDLYILK